MKSLFFLAFLSLSALAEFKTNDIELARGITLSGDNVATIDVFNRILVASNVTGDDAIRWGTRTLLDGAGNVSMTWGPGARQLWDDAGVLALDWGSGLASNRALSDTAGQITVKWHDRALVDPATANDVLLWGISPTVSVSMSPGVGIGTMSPSTELDVVGTVTAFKYRSLGTAPSCTPNANAGTGATCSVTSGTDAAGNIFLTTGTTTLSGAQFDITFNVAYGVAPICVFSPMNAQASGQNFHSQTTTTALTIHASDVNLDETQDFFWAYHCTEVGS